jgi:hypothetical protein
MEFNSGLKELRGRGLKKKQKLPAIREDHKNRKESQKKNTNEWTVGEKGIKDGWVYT